MLLAPFALTLPTRPTPPRRARRLVAALAGSDATRVPPWLVAWAFLGTLAVLCIPALRGGGFGGATLPFWLAAAPLLDIAWLTRARWIAALRARRIGR